RRTKDHFYQLLKPLADTTNLTDDEYVDWGHEGTFATAIGVGECAGVIIDLVATLLVEAEEKLDWARQALDRQQYADSIYHSYNSFVWTAKALLLDKGVNARTQALVIEEFDKHFVEDGTFSFPATFSERVLQINKYQPSGEFAETFLLQATAFHLEAAAKREEIRQLMVNG
ncbi:MAG: HEPN domain-containing protein, partial [Leadbetterella sp.]|nr:HEPN domain-containing protein [Leadbetterella sp.]